MKKLTVFCLLFLAGFAITATPAQAEIEFFGTAKFKPTHFDEFDFNSDRNDAPIVTEGGFVKGKFIRSELRLGWKASGDNWKIKMIAEGDVIMEKDTADRSFYVGAEKNDQPNTGGEFGIERVEALYTFMPQLELQAGWDIRALDIRTGGLLYGDDHPFLGLRGNLSDKASYELLYIPVQNRVDDLLDEINADTGLPTEPGELTDGPTGAESEGDWDVYSLKLSYDVGEKGDPLPGSPFYANPNVGLTISPFVAYSDNDFRQAQVNYYGLEVTGQAGPVNPYFEIVGADGEFDGGQDISSWAMYAGLELPINNAFNPYVVYRYTQGDDDAEDDDVEGWVGITDIGRFGGLTGMDGNVLGSDLGQSYGATLYSYSPERRFKTNTYGGIGNGGSGDNPGQKLVAIGARGDLSGLVDKLLYKTQAFFIWYDETKNLEAAVGNDVDDYAGTTFDLQLLYALSKNFSVDYIFSAFVPGDGIEDQFGDDTAMVNMLTLAWAY